MVKVQKVGMVIQPVEDLEATLEFYQEAMGLELKFRDGDRFAALAAGTATIALAAGEERLSDQTVVSYKVDDVDTAVLELVASGARVLREADDGPHERRAVLCDPAGNPLIVYGARA